MGKYLTLTDRRIIETMILDKKNPKEIAERLGKHYTTIYKEIKLGTVELRDTYYRNYKVYQCDVAQRIHEERQTHKGSELKIGNDYKMAEDIENLIKKHKYSPYAVKCYLERNKNKYKTMICEKTIYNYVDMGLFMNITNKDLPMKKKHKRKYHKVSYKRIHGKSIEERPKEINKRNTFGHWEMDTVVSGRKKSKNCLLVLTERYTRNEIVANIPDKSMNSVVSYLDKLERTMGTKKFKNTFKTITMDNGCEFQDFRGIEKNNRTNTYYCHPYSSCERGSNENQNKLIRRHIPKGCDISKYSNEDIKHIQDWINNYPRKIFNGKSSNEVLKEII